MSDRQEEWKGSELTPSSWLFKHHEVLSTNKKYCNFQMKGSSVCTSVMDGEGHQL